MIPKKYLKTILDKEGFRIIFGKIFTAASKVNN